MKTKHIITLGLTVVAALTMTSCNDYLDANPDNRIDINTADKIKALLTSAYPDASYVRITELASDNTDDLNGDLNGNYDRFSEQCYRWQEVTESDNESPVMVWQSYYSAIGHANQALKAIDEIGGATTDKLRALRGEALLCRAYCHFMLTNIFCQNYSVAHADTDPGIPYVTEPETTLDPKYERGTVAEDYKKIEKDLLEGLSLMSDAIYDVPRYHFNQRAAYTFASRFYLFYQQPEKVVEYSTKALGSNPQSLMRDYQIMQSLPTDQMQSRSQQYTSSSEKANFLLCPVYSTDCFYYQGYSNGARFNTNHYIGQAELFFATPWMPDEEYAQESQNLFRFYWFYSSASDKFMLPKTPYYFEETNQNTHTGYYRTIVVALKSEEALLNRAEAYTLLGNNSKALDDINTWTTNFVSDSVEYNTYKYDENWNYIYAWAKIKNHLTMDQIRNWCQKYDYYRPERPLPRKHLHPDWVSLTEGSDEEDLIQTILLLRRLEFLHEGMRWFDVKRYGMTIYRREINSALNAVTLTDSMSYRDPRQAIQIPFEVRSAGLKGNDRSSTSSTASYNTWTDNKHIIMLNRK